MPEVAVNTTFPLGTLLSFTVKRAVPPVSVVLPLGAAEYAEVGQEREPSRRLEAHPDRPTKPRARGDGADGVRITDDHVAEVVRFGGSELHNVAALLGGMVSQEAIKLITRQYIPLNNTYVFNGIAGTGAVYEL